MLLYVFQAVGAYFGGVVGIVANTTDDLHTVITAALDENPDQFNRAEFIYLPELVREFNVLNNLGAQYDTDVGVQNFMQRMESPYCMWILTHAVEIIDQGPPRVLFNDWQYA